MVELEKLNKSSPVEVNDDSSLLVDKSASLLHGHSKDFGPRAGSCEDHANEPTCICADKNPYWHRLMQKGMHEDFGVKNHMITMSPPPFVATTARRAAAGPQNLAQRFNRSRSQTPCYYLYFFVLAGNR